MCFFIFNDNYITCHIEIFSFTMVHLCLQHTTCIHMHGKGKTSGKCSSKTRDWLQYVHSFWDIDQDGVVINAAESSLLQECKSEWLVRVLRNPYPYLLTPQERAEIW